MAVTISQPICNDRRQSACHAVRWPSVSTEPPLQVTWVGHATVLIEIGGVRLLTDPVLTSRVAHLRRHSTVAARRARTHRCRADLARPPRSPPHPVAAAAATIDDADRPRRAPGACCAGAASPTSARRAPGEPSTIGGVEVDTVPARHNDRRGPHSRVTAAAVGYVVRRAGSSVYFAGDTDLFPEMADLAPVDVALLPIWGWGSTLGEGHLDPARAADGGRHPRRPDRRPDPLGDVQPVGRPPPPTGLAVRAGRAVPRRARPAPDCVDRLHVARAR